MALNINGYSLVGELKNNNSGYGKWGFAVKNGKEYFIKEFLSPIYPERAREISEAQIEAKRKICKEFEVEKRIFYNELNRCSTGNIMTVCDFFRWGNRYYMVTEKVDAITFSPAQVARFDVSQKLLIIKVILFCISALHRHGIVHGDIKPDNVLFKRTLMNVYTAKIIDFDSSFLESRPPRPGEEVQGDTVYLAPETFAFIATEEGRLNRKIDVFALGVLFHQYLSGELPGFDRSKYTYTFESVLDGNKPIISPAIPGRIAEQIAKMLERNPEDRPELEEVFLAITGGTPKVTVSSGGLKSTMGAKVDDKAETTTEATTEENGEATTEETAKATTEAVVSSSGLKSTMGAKVEPSFEDEKTVGIFEVPPVAPVEDAPVEAAPVEVAPVEAAPVEAAPVEAAPVEAAPVEAAPVEVAPVEDEVASVSAAPRVPEDDLL